MLFGSHVFILAFLPAVLLGWWGLGRAKKHRAAQVFLLLASFFFYGFLNPRFVPVLLLSILFNFMAGRMIPRVRGDLRRLALILALTVNLGALAYVKYSNFFLETLNGVFHTSFGLIHLLLPLGISFFTFQQIAYLVDAYRGEAPAYSILEYGLFVSFFPYVISGPIAFHHEIIPQFQQAKERRFLAEQFSAGLMAFSLGLFKKVIIADTFGGAADWGFAYVSGLNTTSAVVVVLSYTFQLYFDFSGYTDMARGVGLMLGIRLPQNFDSPYKALTISGFWKGWHMTMTRFFTRYLYIPLGGSRGGTARTCLNTMLVFLASGLWHGASWTFVVWGALHGMAMVAERLFGDRVKKLHPALSWVLTFAYVNFCWVFFRAESFTTAVQMCKAVLRCDFGGLPEGLTALFRLPELGFAASLLQFDPARMNLMFCLLFLLMAFVICLQGRTVDQRLQKTRPGAGMAVLCALLLFWSLISLTGVSTFLYSNF